jgi:hypothetical protein
LELGINDLSEKWGVNCIGVLTLTIGGKKAPSMEDFSRRFNSLRTHVLKERFAQSIWVVERGGEKGRLHMHGVCVLAQDIRTNSNGTGPVDFRAFEREDYRTAGAYLRAEWAFWRKTAKRYGFGRTSMEPVKCPGQVVGRYFGKYVGKQVEHRIAQDKGARLVRYVGFAPGDRVASSRFGWNNDNAIVWRAKVSTWARTMGLTEETIVDRCGPRWAYVFLDAILTTKLPDGYQWPSLEAYEASELLTASYECRVEFARREAAAVNPFPASRTYRLQPPTDYEKTPF